MDFELEPLEPESERGEQKLEKVTYRAKDRRKHHRREQVDRREEIRFETEKVDRREVVDRRASEKMWDGK